jgi:hypothetical protein
MQRIRIEHKARKPKEDRCTVLSMDPRDPDVLRVKETMRRHPANAARQTAHGA